MATILNVKVKDSAKQKFMLKIAMCLLHLFSKAKKILGKQKSLC